jgi:hypothetical protein
MSGSITIGYTSTNYQAPKAVDQMTRTKTTDPDDPVEIPTNPTTTTTTMTARQAEALQGEARPEGIQGIQIHGDPELLEGHTSLPEARLDRPEEDRPEADRPETTNHLTDSQSISMALMTVLNLKRKLS